MVQVAGGAHVDVNPAVIPSQARDQAFYNPGLDLFNLTHPG